MVAVLVERLERTCIRAHSVPTSTVTVLLYVIAAGNVRISVLWTSNMFKSTGRLAYDPAARIKSEPWWLILRTDPEIVNYYQHWLKQNYDLQFEKTVWGSHISVNRGVAPKYKDLWKKYQGEKIEFTYSNSIYRKHWFFCVDAQSERLMEIREELGLSKLPPAGFHITIGRINKPYLQRKKEQWEHFLVESGLSCGSSAGGVSSLYSLTP